MSAEEKKPEEQKPEEQKPEEQKPEEHVHDEHCHHEEESKVSGKSEKKVRKALSKLGMTKMEGVNRVTMKQKDNYILVVKEPEVFTSSQNPNTFIIFGELSFDDPEKKMSQEAIEKMKQEGEKLKTVTEKPPEQKVEVVPEETGEISEEGLNPDSIKLVMEESKCTRQEAVKALQATKGDSVEAILQLTK